MLAGPSNGVTPFANKFRPRIRGQPAECRLALPRAREPAEIVTIITDRFFVSPGRFVSAGERFPTKVFPDRTSFRYIEPDLFRPRFVNRSRFRDLDELPRNCGTFY